MDAARKGKHATQNCSTTRTTMKNVARRDDQLLQVSEKKKAARRSESQRDGDISMVRTGDVKTYVSSEEARSHAYNKWLERKQHTPEVKQNETTEHKPPDVKHGNKAIQAWTASKEVLLKEKIQREKELAKMEQELLKEKEAKKAEAEREAERWREKKQLELVQSYQERKQREKEEEECRKQEEANRSRATEAAFRVWREKKAESLRAKHKQESEQKHLEVLEMTEKAKARLSDAEKAFEAWKKKKEESVLEEEQQRSYAEPLHDRAWCPARSITHSYPSSEKAARNSRQSLSRKPSRSHDSSLSGSSKLSNLSQSRQSTTPSPSKPHGATDSPEQPATNHGTAKKKSIQVCCQTLEYWCTCKDD